MKKPLTKFNELLAECRPQERDVATEVFLKSFPAWYLEKHAEAIKNELFEAICHAWWYYRPARPEFSASEMLMNHQPGDTCPMINEAQKNLKSDIDSIEYDISELEEKIEERKSERESDQDRLEEQLEKLEEKRASTLEELEEAKLELANKDDDEELNEKVKDLEDVIWELEDNIEGIKEDEIPCLIAEADSDIEDFENEIEKLYEKIGCIKEVVDCEAESLRLACEEAREIGCRNRDLFFDEFEYAIFHGEIFNIGAETIAEQAEEASYGRFDFDEYEDYFEEAISNLEEICAWANGWSNIQPDYIRRVNTKEELRENVSLYVDQVIRDKLKISA